MTSFLALRASVCVSNSPGMLFLCFLCFLCIFPFSFSFFFSVFFIIIIIIIIIIGYIGVRARSSIEAAGLFTLIGRKRSASVRCLGFEPES